MDPARQLDVWHFLQFFILLFFFLHVLVLLGPTEKGTPSLMVSDLQLAKHIVIGDLQSSKYFDTVILIRGENISTLKILCRLVFWERRLSIRNRSISALPSILLPPFPL